MKITHARLAEADVAWLADTFARNRAMFGGWRMEAEGGGEGEGSGGANGGGEGEGEGQTFTQADVDRIVTDRLKREREAARTKYADYEDLKKRAEGAKTAEERITALENEIESARLEAARARIANEFDLDEKAALALKYAPSEEAAREIAEGLAERASERKKQGNRVPREGNNPTSKPNEERETVRNLFGSGG